MNAKHHVALTLATAVAVLLMASVALASHVHPATGGAKKVSFSLVPAFKACTTGVTGQHGSPLVGPSCRTTTASATSATLTTGESPHGLFRGAGSFSLEVFCTDGSMLPCTQEDLKITASLTDVRCKGTIGSNATLCPSTNSLGGRDYAGQVQVNSMIRITDHYNTVTTNPVPACSSTTSCSATVVDLPNPITVSCAATSADATTGGACNLSTTACSTVPQPDHCFVRQEAGKKGNVELGQIVFNDGGTDGLASTSPNTVYARQGIYVP
jgi:hypothetical protein